jgi:hypothetical protein
MGDFFLNVSPLADTTDFITGDQFFSHLIQDLQCDLQASPDNLYLKVVASDISTFSSTTKQCAGMLCTDTNFLGLLAIAA